PRGAEATRDRDGVPEVRALSAHDRSRQHVVRAHAREAEQKRNRSARCEGGEYPWSDGIARSLSTAALWRPAPARRHGPRDRARPAGISVRRAAVEPRCQAAGADANRNQGAAPASENDIDLRDT